MYFNNNLSGVSGLEVQKNENVERVDSSSQWDKGKSKKYLSYKEVIVI